MQRNRDIMDTETHPVVLADRVRVIRQDPARMSEALAYARQAHALAPDDLEILHTYLRCARDIGDVKECVTLLDRAIALAPQHCGLEFQLLWILNYLPEYDRAHLFARAKRWAEKHVTEMSEGVSYYNVPSLNRKLKVGIVSGDFIENSAMTFYEPALGVIDREAFTLYAYSNVEAPNAGTERFKALFDVFRDIHTLSDYELAAQIRCDGIDILMAFGGQCQRNRIGVVAFRPAPIQVDWGALSSLALPQIDYRITDEVLDPPEMQCFHLEELVYLSGGFVTYRPLPASPPVTPLPARINGHITFGSFNNHQKINDQVLGMWRQILQRVPDARLVLKFPRADDPGVRRFMTQRFQTHGIDLDRLSVRGMTDYAEHLRCLGQVDLLLDTYPFNGFRTTLEGLWMGVPTVTLSGTTFVSRMGMAIMKQLDLDLALVAPTPQAYIDWACGFAERWDELSRIRETLRDRLLSSPITDARRWARAWEDALRSMWHRWCEGQAPEDAPGQGVTPTLPGHTADSVHAASVPAASRLDSLLQGDQGLEITLDTDACPEVLLEANALLRSGQHAKARTCLNQQALQTIQDTIALDPSCTDIMYIVARLLIETDQYGPAERCLRMILDRERHPVVLADLAEVIQQDRSRCSEAVVYWQQACELDPDNMRYLQAHAICVREVSGVAACVKLLERGVARAPGDCGLEFQLLWNLNYLPGYDRPYLFQRAQAWAERHLADVAGYTAHDTPPSPTRRLNLGIVSGDFFENSALAFYEPALRAINREAFSLYAYSNVLAPDEGTDRYASLFEVFRDIRDASDRDVAERVHQDRIDILIGFGGQCKGNRIGVLAFKPAPIQVDWGALCSLGFPQIDYRLTDEVLDPPDVQSYHQEELVYLSGGFVTYCPPAESPPVTPLPARSNGYVTFGSFNNHIKITDQVLEMWAQILQRVPEARLVLKFPLAHDPGVRGCFLQRFADLGIEAARIQFAGMMNYADHLCLLGQVDLLLDTYPFNGMRTTLEGLWMGVPTLTLCGTTCMSRAGLAILKQLGLDQACAAQSAQGYIDRACAYATQLNDLACIRASLRNMLLSSSICDPKRYARSLEQAFRHMWRQWCRAQSKAQVAEKTNGSSKREIRRYRVSGNSQ